MKNKLLLALLLQITCLATLAQTFTLQGRVTDSNNNPVELATVAVPKQGRVTLTNLKGEFSITLNSADSVAVRFSMVGYKTKTRVLRRPKGKQTLLIQLFDDTSELAGVTVTEKNVRQVQRNNLMSRMRQVHHRQRETP